MISRSKAGLTERKGIALYTRTPADVTEFIVHWDGGKSPTTEAEELSLLRSYDRYHASNGWGGIGYTLAVGPVTGNVYEARGLDRVGAHTTGHNTSGVGVILIGGPGNLTDKAKDGLREAYRIACDWAGKTALTVHGHLDLGDTDCPGPETDAWLKAGGITTTTEGTTPMANYTTYQGHKIAPGTLAAFKKLAIAFKKATGLDLLITDGYRTYAEQKSLYDRWKAGTFSAPSVAYPGTSLHETGRALDLRDSGSTPGVTVAGNSRSNWIRNNAAKYGFAPNGYSFNEPWHVEYQGDPWTGSGTATTNGGYSTAYIKDIQTRLIAKGYSVGASGVDGSLGPATTAAVKAFQKANGLTVDGLPGPKTLAALKSAGKIAVDGSLGPASIARLIQVLGTPADTVLTGQYSGSKSRHVALTAVRYSTRQEGSAAIRALQRRFGYTGAKVDGLLGSDTIRDWQRSLKVTVDGVLGPNTAKAIQKALNNGKAM